MIEINPSPITTPIKVTRERATIAPVKTDNGRPVLEVMRIAANCVLSPNSARKMVPKVVIKIFQSMAAPFSHIDPSAETFLSGPDRNPQPVFFLGIRASIFFLIRTEGVVCSVEIDQHLPSGQRFDKKITSTGKGFRFRGLVFKREEKFTSAQGPVYLEDIFLPHPTKFEATIFHIFFFCPFAGRKVNIKGLRFDRGSFDGSGHGIFKIDRVVKETFEFLSVTLL